MKDKLKGDIWSFVKSSGLPLYAYISAFYGPDFQKFLMCLLIKDSAEYLFQNTGPSF